MKLITAIVSDSDSREITEQMLKGGFVITKLGSSGGFLKVGQTTFICAVRNERLAAALEIIKNSSHRRTYKASQRSEAAALATPELPGQEISVGGATVFVTNVEEYYKF